jgi:hypothetical protein
MRSLPTRGCHNVDIGLALGLRQEPERPSPVDTRLGRRWGPVAWPRRRLSLAARSAWLGIGPQRPTWRHPGARRSVRPRALMPRRHPAVRLRVEVGTPLARGQRRVRRRRARLGQLKLALFAGLPWPHWHGLYVEPSRERRPAEPRELRRDRVPGNAWPGRPQPTRGQPRLWAAGAKRSLPSPDWLAPGRPEVP